MILYDHIIMMSRDLMQTTVYLTIRPTHIQTKYQFSCRKEVCLSRVKYTMLKTQQPSTGRRLGENIFPIDIRHV